MERKLETEQDRIRYLFEQTGQTQADFAAALGIGQPHLSGIMNTRKPSKRLIVMIAEKTGANPRWITDGTGDIYVRAVHHEDPPELQQVIETARTAWDNLIDADDRYAVAAELLRVLKPYRAKAEAKAGAEGGKAKK